jgi:hypothetical protein
MPRGDSMPASHQLIHALICAEEKAGKTTWLLQAAEAGFNVLLLDGDVAQQRIAELSPEAKARIFYMDVSDRLVGDADPRMIRIVANLFTSTVFLWNDSKQDMYSPTKDPHDPESGACLDEIWEIRPGRLDHTWVLGIDSWTTLQYSAKLDKAASLGVDIADVEKIERNIYSGVGNRLTNIAVTQQKAPCHTVVLGHPTQYEKRKSQDNMTVREATRENEQIIEWTKMIPISSSNPHGFTIGKFFSDIGWIDVSPTGKRTIDFTKTSRRTSGGNLDSKGDPKVDHRFEDLVRKVGGTVPDGSQGIGDGLIIHPAGTFIPASKNKVALGSKSQPLQASTSQPKQVKGLAGFGGLKQSQSA